MQSDAARQGLGRRVAGKCEKFGLGLDTGKDWYRHVQYDCHHDYDRKYDCGDDMSEDATVSYT